MCEELKIENKLRLSSIIKTKFNNNKVLLLKSVLFTFILGFIAHGYMYFNNALSLDALAEWADSNRVIKWKIGLGRPFLVLYHFIFRGNMILPFFTGLLSLLWTSLAVFFVCKLFSLKSYLQVFLVSCIFTLNLTFIVMTCAFLNDIDGNLFAMFLSVLAVYLWRRSKFGYLYAIIPITFSLGIYQSYVSVTIFLVLIISAMDLLYGKTAKQVFLSGLKALVAVLISALTYFVSLKVVCSIFDVELKDDMSYNSMGNLKYLTPVRALKLTAWACVYIVKRLLMPTSLLPTVIVCTLNVIIFLLAGISLVLYLVKNKLKAKELLLLFTLICLMPVATVISTVASLGVIREYMHYSVCLFYLFALLLLRLNFGEFKKEKVNEEREEWNKLNKASQK